MKKLLIGLLCGVLLGCGNVPAPTGITSNSSEIEGVPELTGCKVIVINTSNLNNVGSYLYAIVCPQPTNVTTQYNTGGKSSQTISTTTVYNSNTTCVNGQQYISHGDSLIKLKTSESDSVGC